MRTDLLSYCIIPVPWKKSTKQYDLSQPYLWLTSREYACELIEEDILLLFSIAVRDKSSTAQILLDSRDIDQCLIDAFNRKSNRNRSKIGTRGENSIHRVKFSFESYLSAFCVNF